jgi:hypothetical protein
MEKKYGIENVFDNGYFAPEDLTKKLAAELDKLFAQHTEQLGSEDIAYLVMYAFGELNIMLLDPQGDDPQLMNVIIQKREHAQGWVRALWFSDRVEEIIAELEHRMACLKTIQIELSRIARADKDYCKR